MEIITMRWHVTQKNDSNKANALGLPKTARSYLATQLFAADDLRRHTRIGIKLVQ
jgi:hypothetical protein